MLAPCQQHEHASRAHVLFARLEWDLNTPMVVSVRTFRHRSRGTTPPPPSQQSRLRAISPTHTGRQLPAWLNCCTSLTTPAHHQPPCLPCVLAPSMYDYGPPLFMRPEHPHPHSKCARPSSFLSFPWWCSLRPSLSCPAPFPRPPTATILILRSGLLVIWIHSASLAGITLVNG
ncbi:uncharacterized protein B0H18DRAFT_968978 [Fomitopsis serialis]|uniref:uncharacterized protein n=1 Tax=Fomitopsis serialis TaxID=139415 RepID=UPI0020074CD4|nr:uncharacterized protein B0H18DRAFT_968978 [Neoantrodia serialis]KAH9937065.1 hypothetical protein B0H18DRAFT_968978 [Neoantrodia serialis]